MPRDVASIATWCTQTILKRSDVQTEAEDLAMGVYRTVCQKVPFEELQIKGAEKTLTAGVDTYNLNTLYGVELAGIMSIRYTPAPGRSWRLRRSHTRVYDAVQFVAGIDPRTYARFGNSIELMPAPQSSTASIRVRFWQMPDVSAGSASLLVNPAAWDVLLKWETMYQLYYVVGEAEKAMMLMYPPTLPPQPTPHKRPSYEVGIIPRLWNDLLRTVAERENVDEDFSINPVVRPYTHG